MQRITKEELLNILNASGGAQNIENEPRLIFDAACELFIEERSSKACGLLSRIAKKKEYREKLNEIFLDRSFLYECLNASEPKLRRNSARLMGALKLECDVPALIEALESETVRLVKPSMLLALGSICGDAATRYVIAYRVAPPVDESEEKHYKEECEAVRLVLGKNSPERPAKFTGFNKKITFELRTAKQLSKQLQYELGDYDIDCVRVWPDGVCVMTDDPISLYQARSFTEMLIPLSRGVKLTYDAIANAAKKAMIDMMSDATDAKPPYRYRIGIRMRDVNRAELSKAVSKALSGDMLISSPSNYDIELCVEPTKKPDTCQLYLKPCFIKDTRFSYRKESLPASIHPATAAGILRLASDYLTTNARVLDPFCGSGTMLIERMLLSPCSHVTGVDITPKALEKAVINAEAANAKIEFVCKDCIKFRAAAPYDEVIANMPFGNRVGSHENNTRLYGDFISKLPEWLKPGGIAVLYTMEFTLLKNKLSETDRLELIGRARTEAGGLMPSVFILRRLP